MTDWMPFALVLSAGLFTVLWFLLGAVDRTGADVGTARRAYWLAVATSALAYLLYVVAGEGWLWY